MSTSIISNRGGTLKSNGYDAQAQQDVTAGATIDILTLSEMQFKQLTATAGSATVSTTPFGTDPSKFQDGKIIGLVNVHATNTVTLGVNDIQYGFVAGDDIVLAEGEFYQVMYNSTLERFVPLLAPGGVDLTNIATDVLPAVDGTGNVGTAGRTWAKAQAIEVEAENFNVNDLGNLTTAFGTRIEMTTISQSNVDSPDIRLDTGDVSGVAGDTGNINLLTGNNTASSATSNSGNLFLSSGTASTGGTGTVTILTGSTGATAAFTGAVSIGSGSTTAGSTGTLSLTTGNTTDAGIVKQSGGISIISGDANAASAGISGEITIRTGAAVTRGGITIDADADAVVLANQPTGGTPLAIATTQFVLDNAGGGTFFDVNQVAHGFAVGDGIYHNGTNWVKGQADDSATLAYYCVSEVADVDNFTAADFGRATATAHGFTIGEFYFLSETVAGQPTTTEPPTGFSNPLFFVEDANILQIKVYRPDAVGGGITLDQINDVSAPTPTEGQVLTWDSGNTRWESKDVATVITNLSDLSATVTGGFTNATGTWRLEVQGKVVTVTFSLNAGSTGGAPAGDLVMAGVVPLAYRPAHNISAGASVVDTSQDTIAFGYVDTAGDLRATLRDFTGGGFVAGPFAAGGGFSGSVSYVID